MKNFVRWKKETQFWESTSEEQVAICDIPFLSSLEINALLCSLCITIPSYPEKKNHVLSSFFAA